MPVIRRLLFLAMNYLKLYFTHKIIYNFKKSCDMLILYVSSSLFSLMRIFSYHMVSVFANVN